MDPGDRVGGQLSTRERIVIAADELFYKHGFEPTSFADIASAVNISRGNFYHHFKTKDDILDAVIEARVVRTQGMLDEWEAQGCDPHQRILLFVDILVRNELAILKYGCPVGTLCTELAKLGHTALPEANRLFTLFRVWLRRQFTALGHVSNADLLAMQVLARSQGVATLANAFHDEAFLHSEVHEMHEWLERTLESTGGKKSKGNRRPQSTHSNKKRSKRHVHHLSTVRKPS